MPSAIVSGSDSAYCAAKGGPGLMGPVADQQA
jgi:hypothetical protein